MSSASLAYHPPGERQPERLVFVHGSLGAGADAFAAQGELAALFHLSIPVRRGYAGGVVTGVVDHDHDAAELAAAAAADGGAHLVGTSMGAIVAIKAAAIRPDAVRSLTLIEPPAYAIAADRVEVAGAIAALKAHWRSAGLSNREFMQGFLDTLAMTRRVPDAITPALDRAIALMRTERAWAIDLPVGAVADAGIPTLVVGGGWSPVFDAVCERLTGLIGARYETIRGHGHAVQKAGPSFNALLRAHVAAALAAGEGRQ